MSGRIFAFVGTLNRPAPYFSTCDGKGLGVFAYDEATGGVDLLHEVEGIDNPSFLTLHPAGHTLYATSEVFGWHEGVVTAYRIDHATGALSYINKQPTRGSITAHASFDRTGRWLLVTNYLIGTPGLRAPQAVVVYPVEQDGGVGAPVCSVGHVGHGPDPQRQEGPHPHCAVASPDNRHVLVCDLGIDRVMVYAFNAETGQLTPGPTPAALVAGSGPRHLAFHPDGRFAYITNELASSVTALAWDAAAGALTPMQTIGTVPDDFSGHSHCSDIAVSADGRHLYAANRGHDSIACFAIAEDGRLTALGQPDCGGPTPRQFTLDLAAQFVLVANQNAGAVAVLARDGATGLLHDTGRRGAIGTPMCVRLLRA